MPALDPSTIQIKDYLHVKGVKLADPGMPQWKLKPLQEKNMKLIAEHLEQENARQKEEERWSEIPEWKKQLMLEKEKKLKEKEEAQKRLEEEERKEREKFESLPGWKQELLKKKKGSSEIDANSDTKSENSGEGDDKSDNALISSKSDSNGHRDTEEILPESASPEASLLPSDNNSTSEFHDVYSESSFTSTNMDIGDGDVAL